MPWSGLSAAEVRAEMRRGACLPLDRSSTPPHLYQLMRVGLLLSNQQGDQGMLDLQEIRDMLLFTRVSYILHIKSGNVVTFLSVAGIQIRNVLDLPDPDPDPSLFS